MKVTLNWLKQYVNFNWSLKRTSWAFDSGSNSTRRFDEEEVPA